MWFYVKLIKHMPKKMLGKQPPWVEVWIDRIGRIRIDRINRIDRIDQPDRIDQNSKLSAQGKCKQDEFSGQCAC